MLVSHCYNVFKKVLVFLAAFCLVVVVHILVLAILSGAWFIVAKFTIDLCTMAEVTSLAKLAQLFMDLVRGLAALVIKHFSWLLVMVLTICILIPRRFHATLEELKEEIERRETRAAARNEEHELMIKEFKEAFSFSFGRACTGQEDHLV